ncbi:hypothetical protein ACOMHN_052738 [Nucella lapillus]
MEGQRTGLYPFDTRYTTTYVPTHGTPLYQPSHRENDLHIHQPVVTKGKHKREECRSQTSASRGLVAQGSNLCRQVLPPGPQPGHHVSANGLPQSLTVMLY